MAIGDGAVLDGWGVRLGVGVMAVYGRLALANPIEPSLTEPFSGLVAYVPDFGVTQARLAGMPEVMRIAPGRAYFYATNQTPYLAQMAEPGRYSGVKMVFEAAALSQVQTPTARLYCQNPDRPVFAEMPVGRPLVERVAALPKAVPQALSDQLRLLADLHRIAGDLLADWVTVERTGAASPAPELDAQIDAADRYLKENLAAPPSVLALANQVGLNHMTMKRGFHRLFGTTVYGRLRYWRMQRACELLQAGASVLDTALAVGYANPSKFAAAYRRETGRNPSQG
ncbi:helix-turn-helix transcriptional regulator [Rhodothalassium salexigens]|uniref:helix-turn-helix transcriptional regulator n=1 Tax=Rhodothalassium salexigens TaxID=1086 RepID=UPI001404B153|nr:AraC family transcriptional regulator [Rhodothalassium salexigens]MBB4212188.1 AraC-like DNA-binding protein [Rhodothalassium salexigens DSM 2132]